MKITLGLTTVVCICLLVAACTEQSLTPEAIALNDRGVAQMGRYEYRDAHASFSQVVEASPSWLDARVNLAIATQNRQQDGDQLKALEILTGVLEQDPGHLRALYTSAIIQLYLGEAERAIELFNQVIDADSRDAYATYFLGQAYLQNSDYDKAARWFIETIELDPYLRSAYWAGAQALRRNGQDQKAFGLLEDYKRFADNPAARVAGFSYKRMGPRAEAMVVTPPDVSIEPLPAGDVFAAARPIVSGDWQHTSLTTADINQDGFPDLALTNARGLIVLTGTADGAFVQAVEHPLANIAGAGINAAMWGDINDDGEIDVVLCGEKGSRLWLQTTTNTWESTETGTSTPCKAGAIFDADHDGDLDIFVTGSQGNELLSNNRDGSFRPLAEQMGLRGNAGIQVVAADLDADRDLDILVINESEPHSIWQNDRTWLYQSFPGLDDLRNEPLTAVTVADTDSDGHTEIYAVTSNGDLMVWKGNGLSWHRRILLASASPALAHSRTEMTAVDFDGDGQLELMLSSNSGFTRIDPNSGQVLSQHAATELTSAIPVVLDPGSGPTVVATGAGGIKLWPPGPGRHRFLSLVLSGEFKREQTRSNTSGIGTRVMIRTAGNWTVLDSLDPHSGPGQSLAPLSVGLGGSARADFVALEWSDGVSQTELELAAGRSHAITETQRQLASCPVAFVWNGERYAFISDVLGVGGLGFFASPGVYAPPRPFEGYLLDADQLVARNGRYHVKFSEPMEENAYLDAARIHVYDLPEGWSMVLDERMGILGPEVSGRAITYRRSIDPVLAVTADGKDVTAFVLAKDQAAPPPGPIDKRFIGLLADDQVLTLEFDQPLSRAGSVLVADGWIEYPYSQTIFAAWQAGLRFRAPTLEVRDGEGSWHTIAVEFGYPAGMPRKMALPLPDLPQGTDAIRLTSNMEIYWDRIQLVSEEPLDKALNTTLLPVVASVARTGFAKRSTGDQRLPHYDYANRSAYWDTKFQRGYYTAFGDAMDLVTEIDGAVAIIGGGEEIHLEFESVPDPIPGKHRYFVLDFRGWAKDMDLYTEHGETVGPLPVPEGLDPKALVRREQLHSRYNVRFQEGL
jgi:Flp pilus assembly protein TadD